MNSNNTKREILRSAECVYCGYMVAAPGETIPPALDVTSRPHTRVRCGMSGSNAPCCWTKGGRTVSLIDGRLQYTPRSAGQAP